MDVRTESNFSSDAEERGARHEARAAVQMAQDLRQEIEQGKLQTQENFQQLQAALSQSQQLQAAVQQQQWLMGQQLGAMAADFQNFTARFEKRRAASAMRPQKRETDAARHAAAAAAVASSSESFEPPRRTRGASADLAHQQRAQAAGEQIAALHEQLAAAQQAGAAAEARAAAAEARAADALARAAAAEEEAQRAQRAAERRAVAAEALALAAEARQSAAEEEAAAARGKAQEAEASLAAAAAAEREQLARVGAQLQGAQQAAAALSSETAAAELRATTAEARATAAETATAGALAKEADALAEVQRVREDEARQQAECESLRAALQGIREAGGCPISHGLPRDPVVASDGQTYDRRAIVPWLRDHGTSPLTREPLQPQLHPNRFAAAVLRQLGEIGLGSTADDEDGESSAQSQNPQDAADPEPDALINAIGRRDEAAALALLQRPGPLIGLNNLHGAPVLFQAMRAWHRPAFRVALAILARRDFRLVNWKTSSGSTFLHGAAGMGSLPMCQAILAREDFTEVLAISTYAEYPGLASEVAQRCGHWQIAAFLRNAEAQARRAQRA